MRKIYLFDTTLRDGEQTPGVNLNTQEKVEIALQLERVGIDRIEAGFPASTPGEIVSVDAVSRAVKNASIVALSRCREQDIDAAREALKNAVDPRLHLFLATSPIHRKHKLRMEKHQVLEAAEAAIRYAARYFTHIEFSPEDGGRTEMDFLCEVVAMAVRAGVSVVNIPDTVGYLTPYEYGNIFKTVKETVPGIEKIQLSCHCHDDLGMATANSLAAVLNGADQVEGTFNGIGERAGNTALEEIALALDTRQEFFQAKTGLNLVEIARTSRLVSRLTGVPVPANKAIVGANAFAHESGIHQDGVLKEKTTYEIISPQTIGLKETKLTLGKLSGRHAFRERLIELGYSLGDERLNEAFAKFKDLADKKKDVTDEDIRALIEEKLIPVQESYILDTFQVLCGNQSVPTATIRLHTPGGNMLQEVAIGNGSVDAIYKAIDRAVGESVELVDYTIHSVTNGQDALGEVSVVLAQNGISVKGRGVSTDILEASARAYVDSINRLIEKRNTAAGTTANQVPQV